MCTHTETTKFSNRTWKCTLPKHGPDRAHVLRALPKPSL